MAKQNEKSKIEIIEQAVVITTEHRGVFFGYLDPEQIRDEQIELKRARLCVYWSTAMHGFMGLASMGPDNACKVGPRAPSIVLRKITSVIACSPAAVDRWEKGPWS